MRIYETVITAHDPSPGTCYAAHITVTDMGYEIEVVKDGELVESYYAGNHTLDSGQVVSPESDMAVPFTKLIEYAKQTADEMLTEVKV